MKRIALLAALLATAPAYADQAALEKQFDAQINPNDLKDWLKILAAAPNQVGSAHDKANAEFELAQFRAWGWDAHIETFQITYPTPISETLDLLTPVPFKAMLREPPIEGDSSAAHGDAALPAYLAYQGDGDVTAPLVYVNFGMPDDYDMLARMGVDVRGKIVLARYGGGWRGLKPKLAQEHGAIGCLIYSDPAQDGFTQDDAYPGGPARPAHSVQRGSVQDMTLYPGDPTAPDAAPVEGATHIARGDAKSILKIPALPVSYADAQVFLAALGGRVVPEGWRGGLPVTYHVGPSTAPVHLAVKSDWSLKPIYDVIAVMPGSAFPDQWVIRGNHHDGWVFGASDPLSGQIALMAEAKAIGALVKAGYKPQRTLVYTSWDAEEPGLIGSTSWAQAHADELRRKTVVYVNSDTNSRGIFAAGGSGELKQLVNDVAASVIDPETHVSVAERKRAAVRVAAIAPDASPRDQAEAKALGQGGHDFPIDALGSGSDFSAFLQHLGVPALDLAYEGEGDPGGVYHSAYDTFEHHSRFVDPGFVYDALLAQTVGHLILREADAGLPLQRPGDLANEVAGYLTEVQKLADSKRAEAEARDRLLDDKSFQLAADPQRILLPPKALGTVPFVDFAPLENAVQRLKAAAKAYDQAFSAKGADLNEGARARLWSVMLTIDETLSPPVGLPERPWYKNLIYAPGRFTGYGAKTLPGVREAIEEHRWGDADRYARLTADALDAYSAKLDQGTAVLEGKGK
jgi:N-acetylated-alpha-linked acidic dipeptidase